MAKAGPTIFKHSIGKPTKTGAVKVKIEFRSDGGTKFKEAVVINITKDDTAVVKAGKIATAINTAIQARAEGKGAEATQGKLVFPSGTEVLLPEVYVSNIENFRVTKVSYSSNKTGESIKKRKFQLAMLDPGDGSLDPIDDSEQTALVVFQGEPSKGRVKVGVGDTSLAVVRSDELDGASILDALASRIVEAGWQASIVEVDQDAAYGDDHWPTALSITALHGDSVFVDVEDDDMGYAISLEETA